MDGRHGQRYRVRGGVPVAATRRAVVVVGPWRIVIFTEGLFLLVATIARDGGSAILGELIGHSTFAATTVAAVGSNAVNNLPAYLAAETAVSPDRPTQLFAVLIGTNVGPLVLLWGSLATILWRERCAARGVVISARQFAAVGLGGVPLVLLGTATDHRPIKRWPTTVLGQEVYMCGTGTGLPPPDRGAAARADRQ